MKRRHVMSWGIALAAVLAMAAGVSALQRRGGAVVTPDDPIFARLAAQDPQEPEGPQEPSETSPAQQQTPPATGGRGRGGSVGPRPYDQVVTRNARTDEGIFTVHRINDQILYEIPKAELDKDFLWVSQIKRTAIGAGYGGQLAGSRVVRWQLRGNRVLLRLIDYSIVADSGTML
jgi:hypothetical protein